MMEYRTFLSKPSAVFHGGLLSSLTGTRFTDGTDDRDGKPDDSSGHPEADGSGQKSADLKEKSIQEAFEDLQSEEQETVKRVLDRMTGRKS